MAKVNLHISLGKILHSSLSYHVTGISNPGKIKYSPKNMNIPANTVILPQTWDIRDCICPPISAIIISSRAHGMSWAKRVVNSNFRNNFYKNVFESAQWNKSDCWVTRKHKIRKRTGVHFYFQNWQRCNWWHFSCTVYITKNI